MSTIVEQILATMATQLNTSRPTGIPAVERDRVIDLEPEELPSMILGWAKDGPHEDKGKSHVLDHRQLSVQIAIRAAAGSGLTASQAADAMVAWAVKKLCQAATADSPFHGIAHSIRQGEKACVMAKAGRPYCLVILELIVDYQHRFGDAEQWA